jgi:hypothetical protein
MFSYPAVCESPSMGIICPEIERALSEARNRARAAMSLGSTNLFIDWLASASLVTSAMDLPLALAYLQRHVGGVDLQPGLKLIMNSQGIELNNGSSSIRLTPTNVLINSHVLVV